MESPLAHSQSNSNGEYYDTERPGLATRMGVTPESFKRRTISDKHNQLNKTMKARHSNMIAIGTQPAEFTLQAFRSRRMLTIAWWRDYLLCSPCPLPPRR